MYIFVKRCDCVDLKSLAFLIRKIYQNKLFFDTVKINSKNIHEILLNNWQCKLYNNDSFMLNGKTFRQLCVLIVTWLFLGLQTSKDLKLELLWIYMFS